MVTNSKPVLLAILAGALAMGACAGVGPKKKEGAGDAPKADSKALYEYDLTKPEGPMYQLLRAAQERDEALFKASFAPSVDTSRMSEDLFRKFRKKVLGNQMTPVPESVEMVGENDAIVKLRNSRGREIPVKVTKIDGKWLIAEIVLGDKGRTRNKETNPKAAPAAPAAPVKPT